MILLWLISGLIGVLWLNFIVDIDKSALKFKWVPFQDRSISCLIYYVYSFLVGPFTCFIIIIATCIGILKVFKRKGIFNMTPRQILKMINTLNKKVANIVITV